jgi:hypothetical protein
VITFDRNTQTRYAASTPSLKPEAMLIITAVNIIGVSPLRRPREAAIPA